MGERLVIDEWSDVVCPFCYLGSRQLTEALDRFEHHDDVVLVHHAFELDPHSPLTYELPLDELVARKYDLPVERARDLHRRLEAQAAHFGLEWHFENARPTNTFDAHRLIALAATQELAFAMSQRLYAAYFSEGRLVSDHDELCALATEVGVADAGLLWATDAFANDVRADEMSAARLGINGVPAFLVDNTFMVMGAQGTEAILDVLGRARARRSA